MRIPQALIVTYLTLCGLAFAACGFDLGQDCYLGLLTSPEPKAARNLEDCEFGVCVATLVPGDCNEQACYSGGYCSKECTTDEDCADAEGYKCDFVIRKEDVAALESRGYQSPFCPKDAPDCIKFCVNSGAAVATLEQNTNAATRYAEERKGVFDYTCEKEMAEEGKNGDCPEARAAFCYTKEAVETSPEYIELCCGDAAFVRGYGGILCCPRHLDETAEYHNLCCASTSFLADCDGAKQCGVEAPTACAESAAAQ